MRVNGTVFLEDFATPAIEAKVAKCSPRRVGAIIGMSLAEFWRNRLKSLGTNKKGWPSTKFWERAARSVKHIPQPEGVYLEAEQQGLRQRWHGGHIAPVTAKALAIPISPVSYGHLPREFPGLFLMRTPKGAYLVQYGQTVSGLNAAGAAGTRQRGTPNARALGGNAQRRQRASLNFLFVLSGGVDQEPDDRVVPSPEEFAEVAMARIEQAVN